MIMVLIVVACLYCLYTYSKVLLTPQPLAIYKLSIDDMVYSPCRYPEKNSPQYSIGDQALSKCIESIKSLAKDAAAQWPRNLVSTLSGKGMYYKTQIINYILPTWQCPTEERIGGFTNNGGKWICAPRIFLNKNEKCLVYSFGSNANFRKSFYKISHDKCFLKYC